MNRESDNGTPQTGTGLDAKVAFLSDPGSYPGDVVEVEAIETHFSWVFLAGRRAYKLKKPVHLARMDFTTLDARQRNCHAEVRLNRRLTSGVYLGVVALTIDARAGLHLRGDGPPVEWLIEMRRLPRERMLDRAIGDRWLTREHLEPVAHRLADFYGTARPVKLSSRNCVDTLRARLEGDCAELRSTRYALPRTAIDSLCEGLHEALARHAPEIAARQGAGRVIEAHGDLRPEHILVHEPTQIIDCLEFDRSLRVMDWAEELAFLELECMLAGAGWAGKLVLERCQAHCGDRISESLYALYTACRATARAKLAARHLVEDGVTEKKTAPRKRTEHYIRAATEAVRRARL